MNAPALAPNPLTGTGTDTAPKPGTPAQSSKADTLVQAIKAAYAKAEGSTALAAAIECGRELVKAKAIIDAEKSTTWGDWCEKIAGVPQTSDSLYRRFAKHEAAIRNAKSIREAREIVQDLEKTERETKAMKTQGSNGVTTQSPSGTVPDPLAIQAVLATKAAKSATASKAKLKSFGAARERMFTQLNTLDPVQVKPIVKNMIERLQRLLAD
jgi:hypothetical protein